MTDSLWEGYVLVHVVEDPDNPGYDRDSFGSADVKALLDFLQTNIPVLLKNQIAEPEILEDPDFSAGGRKRAQGRIESPEWWFFYRERLINKFYGRTAQRLRLWLGLSKPLEATEVTKYIKDLVEQNSVPEKGAHGWLLLPAGSDPFGFEIIIWTGTEKLSGNLNDFTSQEVMGAMNEAGVAKSQIALAILAQGDPAGLSRVINFKDWDFWMYVLCNQIRPKQLLQWSAPNIALYEDNLILEISSIVVTPEQVRAIYSEARETILKTFSAKSRFVPKEVSANRIKLVKFVEDQTGGIGPHDWPKLLEEWLITGGSPYTKFETMKSAYYAAALPVKKMKLKELDRGSKE